METKQTEKEPHSQQHLILSLLKTGRHFGGNLIHGKNNYEVRLLFKELDCWSPISQVLVRSCGEGGGSGWGLLCCFLNGCQEKFNGYGIWTGKSRLEVSEEAGICGSRSTSVCVLLGWLHFGHRFAPLLARKSVKRFSTYECGASGEYLPATCRPRPIDLHPSRTNTHTHCWTIQR